MNNASRTDSELIVAASRDPVAFRELYDRYAQAIFDFAKRRTRDHHAALDITAESFAQAWQHRRRFSDQVGGSAGPWLFGIARNVLLRAVRDGRMRGEAAKRLSLTMDRSTLTPDASWVEGLDADLDEALEALPAQQRVAVKMRVLDDRSYGDIAEDLECTEGAARIRVSRGLTALRLTLKSGTSQEL